MRAVFTERSFSAARFALALAILFSTLLWAVNAVSAVATPTQRATGGTGGGGGTITIASSSPTADAELYVLIAWAQTSGSVNLGATPVSSAFSISGSWEAVISQTTAVGSYNVRGAVYRARASSSPGTGTVTVNFASGLTRGRAWLVEVASGFDTTTPVRQTDSVTTGTSGTTVSDTLTSAPRSGSVLIQIAAGAAAAGANTAPESGWTEVEQFGTDMAVHWAHAAGSNGSGYGATWDATRDGGMIALAFEVQEPASSTVVPIFQHHQLLRTQ